VRYLSNASTGAQGIALAEEALERGWHVDFVHGPLEVKAPGGVSAHPVTTAREMLVTCERLHPFADVVIGAAAVSDYRPSNALPGKRKRGSPWVIELVPTEDILASLGKRKGRKVHAGFALETDNLLEEGRRKLREKNLDWIVANPAGAIGAQRSHFLLLGANGTERDLGIIAKRELAKALIDVLERQLESVS
jgi:phosphopantothenoylcysteine decarboxylase/phosphopantothenate--cysteine ligase